MPNHSLLADEHIPKTVVQRLESYGIEVLHVEDIGMKGAGDSELIRYALENDYSILTIDDDFRKLGEENQWVSFYRLRDRVKNRLPQM